MARWRYLQICNSNVKIKMFFRRYYRLKHIIIVRIKNKNIKLNSRWNELFILNSLGMSF